MLEALAPLHPRLVHFPIALSVVGAFFVAFGLFRREDRWINYGQTTLLLGWFGIIAAIITGLIDQSFAPVDAAVNALINQHITAGIALVVAVGLALYWPLRNKRPWSTPFSYVYVLLLVVIVALVALEGWLGGKLVYVHGVGVR